MKKNTLTITKNNLNNLKVNYNDFINYQIFIKYQEGNTSEIEGYFNELIELGNSFNVMIENTNMYFNKITNKKTITSK